MESYSLLVQTAPLVALIVVLYVHVLHHHYRVSASLPTAIFIKAHLEKNAMKDNTAPFSITAGFTDAANHTAVPDAGSSIAWTVDQPSVLSVVAQPDSSAIVSPVGIGTAVITVTYTSGETVLTSSQTVVVEASSPASVFIIGIPVDTPASVVEPAPAA